MESISFMHIDTHTYLSIYLFSILFKVECL